MAGEYKRLAIKQFAKVQERETPEARYWRQFGGPKVETHEALCTSVHYSPVAPYDLAVSCGTHVSLRSGVTAAKLRAISRFTGAAYSGVFRNDGRLIAGGDARGAVIVADATSKALLRTFGGHTAATRAVRWSLDGLRLASASDDKTVRFWDLPTGTALGTRTGHTDYVRAMDASCTSPDCWITGSYDGTVKVWDIRQAGGSSSSSSSSSSAGSYTMSVNHEAPVEACMYLPGGGLFVSAGGNYLKVWDMLSGGKLLHTCSNHQKTITCLALDGTQTRLLSGGLDRHVKIYSLTTYQVTHGLKFHAPVLSIALSPDGGQMACGTSDCMLTIRKRDLRPELSKGAKKESMQRDRKIRTGTLEYFNRGAKGAQPADDDITVESHKRKALAPYDKALRKFRYQEALDLALATRNPATVATVLDELVQRRGMLIALGGRDEASLEPLLAFLARHIANPKYASLLIDVAHAVVDTYSAVLGESEGISELFKRLNKQVHSEVKFQKDMARLLGGLDAVIAAGATAQSAAAAAAGSSARAQQQQQLL